MRLIQRPKPIVAGYCSFFEQTIQCRFYRRKARLYIQIFMNLFNAQSMLEIPKIMQRLKG